jgi:hypothetical protein
MDEMEVIECPTGEFAVMTVAWEARNSQWVYSPSIINTHAGAVILTFSDNYWSADEITWCSGTVVHLTLRKFPGDHSPSQLELLIDCANETGTVGSRPARTFTEIEMELESAFVKKPSKS